MDKILEKVKEYWKMIVLVVCGLIAGGIFLRFNQRSKANYKSVSRKFKFCQQAKLCQ